MTIAIDCRHLDFSGIGVYIQGCLPYFLNSNNFFYLIGNPAKLESFISGRKNVEVLDYRRRPFSLIELFFFPKKHLAKINKSDLFLSPYFNIPGGIKVPVYTTIHDIIFPDMPEIVSKMGLAMRMVFYRRAFSRSKKIFTVSEFSKSRIEHYSRGSVPVTVTYNAIQPWIQKQKKNGKEKRKTIVFIGNIKKHKGLDCLLDAFLLARAEGLEHQLVIIGRRNNLRSSDNSFLKKLDSLSPDTAFFTGYISNEKLVEYLSSAALLVQPSRYEGFGLPPLEAMVLGTQALISDIPAFKEIYDGFPVVFFRSGDSDDLKKKLLELLVEKCVKTIALPEHLLSKYTFQKTASIMLENMVP
ncbi:MAG: glycosyltransferase family 4 protein [Treponema sp.]|nr:glycosyltransferase family 4 protein [Treponema sp.]